MGDLGTQLTSEQWEEFRKCVKEAGIETALWYEAVEYTGPTKVLHVALFVKRGWFSSEQVAVGNDYEDLETIASYIDNTPEWRNCKFSIETGKWQLQRGCFAIVEKNGFRGGDKQAVVNLLRNFGINQELIDETLNEVTETVLGYTILSNSKNAQRLAEIVQIGATTPISREEMVKFAESIRRGAAARVAAGDKSAETFIPICQKIADYWRTITDDQLNIKLAHKYYDEGLIDKAIAEYQKAIQINPKNADWHYCLGILLAENCKLNDAIVEYTEAIRINPTHYSAHNNLGQIYESEGKLEEAKDQFRNAIKIDPNEPNAHGNLGIVYYHQGILDQAIAEYQECRRLDPKLSSVMRDLEQIAQDDRNKSDELEKKKVKAWHTLSRSNVVRFWGISLHRMRQLMKECEQLEILYEPLWENVTQYDIDGLFAAIAECKHLTLDQKAIADFALLAIVDGCIPPPRGTKCLKVAFQSKPDLLEDLLKRCFPSPVDHG